MQSAIALIGADIHDGDTLHRGQALLVRDDGRVDIARASDVPPGYVRHELAGGTILPGFVDLQVNGGGGVMFNDDQTVAALRRIAQAHAAVGTVALLPTLITDTAECTRRAIDAVEQAIAEGVAGIVGLHLEGPHLSVARKGAHDPALIRKIQDDDMAVLLSAAARLPNVMLTIAPETVSDAQIRALSDAGIIVSLGHTDAAFERCIAAYDHGARCATHLFNAMSQLANRDPGLVGAVLSRRDVAAGLIADAIHVHPATARIALAAEGPERRIFLVSDAMATLGSDITSFTLNGRTIHRSGDRLTLADGTLAGAHLELPTALRVLTGDIGQSVEAAIARATSIPARVLRRHLGFGQLAGSPIGRIIYLDGALSNPVPLASVIGAGVPDGGVSGFRPSPSFAQASAQKN